MEALIFCCQETLTPAAFRCLGRHHDGEQLGRRCWKPTHGLKLGLDLFKRLHGGNVPSVLCRFLLIEELLIYEAKHFRVLWLESEEWISSRPSALMKRSDCVHDVASKQQRKKEGCFISSTTISFWTLCVLDALSLCCTEKHLCQTDVTIKPFLKSDNISFQKKCFTCAGLQQNIILIV